MASSRKKNSKPMAGGTMNAIPTRAEFERLRQLANSGDLVAQDSLKRLLDAHPEIWRRLGDLAAHAQLEFIRLIAKDEFLLTEAIRRKAEEMRRELLGVFPTPLEVLAIERVVAAWLQVQYVDGLCARGESEASIVKLWLQRQRQAHRLHEAAVKSLLMVRALLAHSLPVAPVPSNSCQPVADGHGTAESNGHAGNGTGLNRVAAVLGNGKKAKPALT